MKISNNFLIKQVAGRTIVVPVGKAALDFNAVISLNETGAFLFSLLRENDLTVSALTDKICAEYDVAREKAECDILAFAEKIKDAGMLE